MLYFVHRASTPSFTSNATVPRFFYALTLPRDGYEKFNYMINNLNYTLNFIENTPKELRAVVLDKKFGLTSKLELYNLNTIDNEKSNWHNLIIEVLDEIDEEIDLNINSLRSDIQNENKLKEYYSLLKSVGCTDKSLSIKGSVFTNLWKKFKTTLNDTNIFETILMSLKSALESLTNLYSSLKIVFPFLEKLKEYIDILLGVISLVK